MNRPMQRGAQQRESILPLAPKKPETDMRKYQFLIYGREKIGKTTLLSGWDDALFLSTEPGTKGLSIYEIPVESWRTVRKAVEDLERSDRFKTVVIDTVDRAYDMCLNFVCEERGIPYPGEDDAGKKDFGKSWHAVKQEFLSVIHRIAATGRGICYTSHSKEAAIRTRSGEEYQRIIPTMSAQARSVIEAIVDMFFYAEYLKNSRGENIRVLITQGDETVWAGCRQCVGEFPQILPLLPGKDGFEMIQRGFLGEHEGLDPRTLLPGRDTREGTKRFLSNLAAKARLKEGGGAPRKVAPPTKR